MPLYEYMCKQCGKKSEILVRSPKHVPVCECGSDKLDKIFSAFSVSHQTCRGKSDSCIDGSCSLPSSPCSSGMCGM